MANTDTEATIEALLEQRAQYEEWLLRLDTSGDKASPSVRQRVRGDYQARLDGVMEQLRSRGAAISEELERQHASQAEIDRERRRAEEALAEAEVRHSVGEYDEAEWKRLSEQSKREIEQLRTRLRSIGAEITRLTEIQTLIAAPRGGSAAPAAAPATRAARPQVIEEAPLVTHLAESFDEPAPSAAPAGKPSRPEPAGVPGDELAFLKSVSDEEPSRLTGRGSSNPGMASPTVAATPKAPEPATSKAASGVAKTLKCGECGTLNRPTEWYCERCGAELAGV
ncbi:MAG TPA: zinc finger Ran-binding domain-containing protein [Gemmatimonadales bacterium]|nr:zinc finger Ran-binding domain-containing protein [Gemmatimonadales bacterium]